MNCPGLAVPSEVMRHVVSVESGHNPYAIGVVGARLQRQPGNLGEAVATVRMLEKRGHNYSLGAAQINRANLKKVGLDTYEKVFGYCPSLAAGSRILSECFLRSGHDWGKAFSCYYSGNFVTGYEHGYVQRVFASMAKAQPAAARASMSGQPLENSGDPAPRRDIARRESLEPAPPRRNGEPFVPEVRRLGVLNAADTPSSGRDAPGHDPADLRTADADGAFVF